MPNLTRRLARINIAVLSRLLRRVSQDDRSWLAGQLGQSRRDPNMLALADFCSEALLAWKNKRYAIAANGEVELLARLAPFGPRCAIDAGANVGDWSLAAATAWPGAQIHAFEIALPTAVQLRKRLATVAADIAARITINPQGLSDHAGVVELCFSASDSTATTMVPGVMDVSAPEHGLTSFERIDGQVIRGDAYLAAQGITHLDMLKIDVEGAEVSVLDGFSGAFARGAIDVVQFEYGPLNIRTRQFLGDHMAFFDRHGFVTGKLFPDGVEFKSFELTDEDFVGPNFVACRKGRADLIAALGSAPIRLR